MPHGSFLGQYTTDLKPTLSTEYLPISYIWNHEMSGYALQENQPNVTGCD